MCHAYRVNDPLQDRTIPAVSIVHHRTAQALTARALILVRVCANIAHGWAPLGVALAAGSDGGA